MSKPFRGLAVALVTLALTATTGTAAAKPPTKPGAPGDLTLNAGKDGATYAVSGTWTAGANATRYVVRLTAGAVTLDSSSVTTLSWTAHTTSPDGTTVTMTVISYNGNRKGGQVTKNLVLPDLTAPSASYSVTHDPEPNGPNVTVTAVTLSDNTTLRTNLEQTIDWGDGSTPAPWDPDTNTISHPYADVEERYEAAVTVTDEAGNTGTFPLVVVVNDVTAPTGAFALDAGTAWASWTKVGVSQAAISDNQSPDDKIARVINWGDGAQTVWAPGTSPTHVYAAGGSYSPTVVLTDEAGNESVALDTSTVVVTVDSTGPVVRLTPPRTKTRSVTSWRTLKGKSTDAGVGVKSVVLKAVQKRATGWYAYNGATKRWAKAASKARAWKKTTSVSVKPSLTGTWAGKLARLTKGTLYYKARGFDNVNNASGWKSKRAVLTRR